MASVTKISNEQDMADEDDDQQAKPSSETGITKGKGKSEPLSYASAKRPEKGPGFFTLYKRGQGYWTRVGTVAGAAMVGVFTAYNLYVQLPTFLPNSIARPMALKISAAVVAVFALGYSWLAWYLLNKPGNVDFLIATDSEMKKVNWTSRAEIIGSTKIVIIFMFLVAIFLLVVDQIFGWLMFFMHVLKFSPLG
jgi:preprotein translocase subunit SecE